MYSIIMTAKFLFGFFVERPRKNRGRIKLCNRGRPNQIRSKKKFISSEVSSFHLIPSSTFYGSFYIPLCNKVETVK